MISSAASVFAQSPRQSMLPGVTAVIRRVLRIPLVMKVMGANTIIVAVALALVGGGLWGDDQGQLMVVLAALTVACGVNLLLVRLALSPIGELERMSKRVSRGEFGARATPSLVADPQLVHLTDTVNSLLDSLATERQRIQKLGALVVSAQDTERARLARELHDSIAQTLAAVGFQLSAASARAADDDMRNTLATARGMIGKAVEEVRNISYSLHPRVAEDLGLVTALESLAQQTSERGALRVKVTADIGAKRVPASTAATLFRVAQESLKNAELRTTEGSAEILLYSNDGSICLEISDDSHGLDSRAANDDNSRTGLASIMDRVALSGGVMRIETKRNGGMKVTAELHTGEDTE
jgi:signal transduction histidine kinase